MSRPRKYEDSQHFADKVDAYFAKVEKSGGMPFLSELSLELGFEDRHGFMEYEGYEPEFSTTVKRARAKVELSRHRDLISRDRFTPGLIFDLKNNHGWKDQTQQELSGKVITEVRRTLVRPSHTDG